MTGLNHQVIKRIMGTGNTPGTVTPVNPGEEIELLVDEYGRVFVRQLDGMCIAMGHANGWLHINKFGAAPSFAVGDNEVTVWDGTDDGQAWENMVYDWPATATVDSMASTDDGDAVDIEIQGLDASYNLVTQTITLNGQSRVALATDLLRVFRAKNVGSTNLAGTVSIFENDTMVTVPGVPDDPDLIRAVIHPENNQTEMAIYTIPAGYTGYLWNFYASDAGASKDSNYIIKLLARPFGQVFQLKHRLSLSDTATSAKAHEYRVPLVFTEKTDIMMTAQMTAAGGSGAAIASGFHIVIVPN